MLINRSRRLSRKKPALYRPSITGGKSQKAEPKRELTSTKRKRVVDNYRRKNRDDNLEGSAPVPVPAATTSSISNDFPLEAGYGTTTTSISTFSSSKNSTATITSSTGISNDRSVHVDSHDGDTNKNNKDTTNIAHPKISPSSFQNNRIASIDHASNDGETNKNEETIFVNLEDKQKIGKDQKNERISCIQNDDQKQIQHENHNHSNNNNNKSKAIASLVFADLETDNEVMGKTCNGNGISGESHKDHTNNTAHIDDDDEGEKCGAFAPSQIIGEDILCGNGLCFENIPLDHHSDLNDFANYADQQYLWIDKFADIPGVTRWEPSKKKYIRKSKKKSYKNGVLYRSAISLHGTSVHLGNHQLSVSAAASLDLANILFWGSEYHRPLHVLSRMEAYDALLASGAPGIHPGGHIDPHFDTFTENHKKTFQYYVDRALTSIGGSDDKLASLLSSIDEETHKLALHTDQLTEIAQLKALKKQKRKQARINKMKANNTAHTPPSNTPLFQGQHGQFDVSDSGSFCWRIYNTNSKHN